MIITVYDDCTLDTMIIPVYYDCTLYTIIINVYYDCTLDTMIITVSNDCTLALYTMMNTVSLIVHYISLQLMYTMIAHCIL